jgi:hypothetical protein
MNSKKVPIRLHPANPKLFEFRGTPLVLICATEHYGAVMNRPFAFEKYLADAADKKQTVTRLFTLFRELANPLNPSSTCKPDSFDYISPFPRTGPGTAKDTQPKYDLDRWNPEFFERLHRFLSLASDLGIVVELTLLSNTYAQEIWELNPLHHANNINGLEDVAWPDYLSTRHAKLFSRQRDYVKKLVEETRIYDNLIYEVCNEPGGLVGPGFPTLGEVDDWQMTIADLIRQTDAGSPRQHLIAGQEAFAYQLPDASRRAGPDVYQSSDKSFDLLSFDVVNMHPLSNMIVRDKYYDLGQFMMARPRLHNLQKYCRDLSRERKPFNLDEDNCASRFMDPTGWTIHRKRAWITVLSDGHYDVIDFSIQNFCESGSPGSQQYLRNWMKYLSAYIHSLDLLKSHPFDLVLSGIPHYVVSTAFGEKDKNFVIYFADAREPEEPGHGDPIKLELELSLPDRNFVLTLYSPTTGLYSPPIEVTGHSKTILSLPTFTQDTVVRLTLETTSQA